MLHEVNERGTNLWMSLIFSGYQITATSGMDLHNRAKLQAKIDHDSGADRTEKVGAGQCDNRE